MTKIDKPLLVVSVSKIHIFSNAWQKMLGHLTEGGATY